MCAYSLSGLPILHRELLRRGDRALLSRCGPQSGGRGLLEAGIAHSGDASKFRRPASGEARTVKPKHLSRAGSADRFHRSRQPNATDSDSRH
jgi:hypothetical protein